MRKASFIIVLKVME